MSEVITLPRVRAASGTAMASRGNISPIEIGVSSSLAERRSTPSTCNSSSSLDRPIRRARLYATARGVYEFYLNGSRVGEDVFAPGWTDYDRRVQYQVYDVTPLLSEGPNAIGAVLGDGWYSGFFGFDPKHRGAHYGPHPQLLAQLELEYEDGSRECIATDSSWRCSTGPILFSDLLLPLEPMGVPFDFVRGEGPAIENPLRTEGDIDRLKYFEPREALSHVLEAIRMIRRELDG